IQRRESCRLPRAGLPGVSFGLHGSAHKPEGVPGRRAKLSVSLKACLLLNLNNPSLRPVAESAISLDTSLRLPLLETIGPGLLTGPEDLARVQGVRGLAGDRLDWTRGVTVIAEIPGRAQEREVGDVLELHEELLSSWEGNRLIPRDHDGTTAHRR